jgi:hypothetical protein
MNDKTVKIKSGNKTLVADIYNKPPKNTFTASDRVESEIIRNGKKIT